MLKKIISGGQTGVDRAALDVALALDIPYEGWCPKGRIDELGIIPKRYFFLKEISGEFINAKENYATRTKFNIRDSNATLIIVPQVPLSPKIIDGTLVTFEQVKHQNKPYLVINLSEPQQKNVTSIVTWVKTNSLKILNIAGPRESSHPGIYELSSMLLKDVLNKLKRDSLC